MTIIKFFGLPLNRRVKFMDYSSAKKIELINKKYPNKVGLIYGSMDKVKDKIAIDF